MQVVVMGAVTVRLDAPGQSPVRVPSDGTIRQYHFNICLLVPVQFYNARLKCFINPKSTAEINEPILGLCSWHVDSEQNMKQAQ